MTRVFQIQLAALNGVGLLYLYKHHWQTASGPNLSARATFAKAPPLSELIPKYGISPQSLLNKEFLPIHLWMITRPDFRELMQKTDFLSEEAGKMPVFHQQGASLCREKKIQMAGGQIKQIWKPESLSQVLGNLRAHGVCLVDNLLAGPEIDYIQKELLLDWRYAAETTQAIERKEPNIAFGRVIPGRMHIWLRGTLFDKLLAFVHPRLLQVGYSYFEEAALRGAQLYCSDMLLVYSDPGAVGTNMIRDSERAGLTVILPLYDIQHPIKEILPGSHTWQCPNLVRIPAENTSWKTTSALFLDNQVGHRYVGSETFNVAPLLVVRYELIYQNRDSQGQLVKGYHPRPESALSKLAGTLYLSATYCFNRLYEIL